MSENIRLNSPAAADGPNTSSPVNADNPQSAHNDAIDNFPTNTKSGDKPGRIMSDKQKDTTRKNSSSKIKRLSEPRIFKKENCLNFIHNKENKTYCGRTCDGWGKLCIYYATFLICALAFFLIIIMIVLSAVQSKDSPFYPIPSFGPEETNSVLNFFPKDDYESTKISYSIADTEKIEKLVQIVNNRLRTYTAEDVQECENKTLRKRSEDPQYNTIVASMGCDEYEGGCENLEDEREFQLTLPCRFDVSHLGPCNILPFGYGTDTPCVYIKINKVLGWQPKPYEKDSVLPDTMPLGVKQHILGSETPKLWLHCEGQTLADKQQISTISYYPEQAFETKYFPYTLNGIYQSPLIAVQTKVKDPTKPWALSCFLWIQETYIIELVIQYSLDLD